MYLKKITRRFLLLSCLFIETGIVLAQEPFSLSASPLLSNDGKTVLTWSAPENARVNIQQSADSNFTDPSILYQGRDSATVITGLMDGDYHYRGRIETADGSVSPWSSPTSITVKHHSLVRAFSFFMTGLLVFLATLLLIVLGARGQGAKN